MPSLTNRIALITGSVSGIGRGIAELFASIGAKVVVHGPDAEVASAAGDLADPAVCRQIVRSAVEEYGGLDILVNNAASTARASLEDSTLEFWDQMMAVNLRAPFLCLQEAVRVMKARGGGSIV